MAVQFQKATKKKARARIALAGPSGAGKTFSALAIATGLGRKVALIDSEHGSASKYADAFEFDAVELDNFDPRKYVEAIQAAEAAGYDVLIIDSLSHAWAGTGGALDIKDAVSKRNKGDSFGAWREVTPIQNQLIEAILKCRCHVIATMRVKTEYVIEKNEQTGKNVPRKIGLSPVQRDQVEYEFDIVGEVNNAELVITKTRCAALHEAIIQRPGADFGRKVAEWLDQGDEAPRPEPTIVREDAPMSPAQVHQFQSERSPGHGGNELARRARAGRLWKQAQNMGMKQDGFRLMATNALNKDVPSVQWTDADLDLVEAALNVHRNLGTTQEGQA